MDHYIMAKAVFHNNSIIILYLGREDRSIEDISKSLEIKS